MMERGILKVLAIFFFIMILFLDHLATFAQERNWTHFRGSQLTARFLFTGMIAPISSGKPISGAGDGLLLLFTEVRCG
jgi:hypothetical protein